MARRPNLTRSIGFVSDMILDSKRAKSAEIALMQPYTRCVTHHANSLPYLLRFSYLSNMTKLCIIREEKNDKQKQWLCLRNKILPSLISLLQSEFRNFWIECGELFNFYTLHDQTRLSSFANSLWKNYVDVEGFHLFLDETTHSSESDIFVCHK